MEKIYYNKLARDKIPDIINSKGFQCEVREMDHDEYRRELIRKVFEEASGVSSHTSHEHLIKELADLVLTIDAVKKEFDISDAALDAAVEISRADKGGYDKRLYLSWSSDTDYTSHDSQARGFDD